MVVKGVEKVLLGLSDWVFVLLYLVSTLTVFPLFMFTVIIDAEASENIQKKKKKKTLYTYCCTYHNTGGQCSACCLLLCRFSCVVLSLGCYVLSAHCTE